MGSLIAGAVAISQATKNVKSNIRSQLGALVTLHADESLTTDIDLWNWTHDYKKINHFNQKMEAIFEQVSKDEKVSFSELLIGSRIHSKGIISISDSTVGYNLDYYDSKEVPESEMIFESNIYNIFGVTNPSFADIEENNIILTQGRSFTDEELASGANVIILDESFKRINDYQCNDDPLNEDFIICEFDRGTLNVGDKVHLSTILRSSEQRVIDSQDIEYEIIGFYRPLKNTSSNNFSFDIPDYKDRIYTSKNNIEKVISNYYEEFKNAAQILPTNNITTFISSATIRLNDPEYVNTFKEKLKTMLNNEAILHVNIYASSDTYEAVCGPLESLSFISDIIFVVSVLVAVLILSLVITLFIKDRRHEIGIYVSLGEKKWRIVSQIVLEVYLTGVLALGLSLFSGNLIGQHLSETILASQIEKQKEVIETKLSNLGSVNPDNVDIHVVENEFEIEINSEFILTIFGVGSTVMIISSLIPVAYTLRIKPKDILM